MWNEQYKRLSKKSSKSRPALRKDLKKSSTCSDQKSSKSKPGLRKDQKKKSADQNSTPSTSTDVDEANTDTDDAPTVTSLSLRVIESDG